MEKVPDNGAALLVYYHGALPIDMYYIIAKMLLYKKRSLKNVVATFLFRLPGISYHSTPFRSNGFIQHEHDLWNSARGEHWSFLCHIYGLVLVRTSIYISFAGFKIMLDVFGACSPTREECVKMLKVGLSPVIFQVCPFHSGLWKHSVERPL